MAEQDYGVAEFRDKMPHLTLNSVVPKEVILWLWAQSSQKFGGLLYFCLFNFCRTWRNAKLQATSLYAKPRIMELWKNGQMKEESRYSYWIPASPLLARQPPSHLSFHRSVCWGSIQGCHHPPCLSNLHAISLAMVAVSCDAAWVLFNPLFRNLDLHPHQVCSPSSDYLSVNFQAWSYSSLLTTRPSFVISPTSSLSLNYSMFILTAFRTLLLPETPLSSFLLSKA